MDEGEPRRKLMDNSRTSILNITKLVSPQMNHDTQRLILEVALGEDTTTDSLHYKAVMAPFLPMWRGTEEDIKDITSLAYKQHIYYLLTLPVGSPRVLLDLLSLLQFGFECWAGVTHQRTQAVRKLKLQTSVRTEVLAVLR